MDHVEDLTPGEYKFSWLPNASIDELMERNLLALALVQVFNRHAAGYGMTLSKLVSRAGAPGKTQISAAYNDAIEMRYLCRVEFTYQLPEGGRPRRYTWHGTSRVPISEPTFARITKRFTRGSKTLVRLEGGEVRRVTVLAAEVYCHLGPMRISEDSRLHEHVKARGRSGRAPVAPAKRAQPQCGGLKAPVVEAVESASTTTCGDAA